MVRIVPLFVLAAAIVASVALTNAPLAFAHGRLAETYEVLWHPTDPDIIAINTTIGLVVTRDGGETWRWVCRDALQVSATVDPPFLIAEDAYVGATFDGVVRGELDGCAWSFATPELERIVTIDLVRHPTQVETLFALTSSGGDFVNLLYRSDDHGRTWAPTSEPIEPILFERVRVAPSDPARIYLSGSYPRTLEEPERRPFVHRSIDEGASWASFAYPFRDGDRNIFLLGVDPNDPEVVYARISREAERPELDERLVRSSDGGETWEDLFEVADLRAFAFSEDARTIWVGGRGGEDGLIVDSGFLDGGVTIGKGRGLWRSVDGGEFEQVRDDLSIGCLYVRDGTLWACAWSFTDGFAVGYSNDEGATFTPFFDFFDMLGPVECEGEVPDTCSRQDFDINRDLMLNCDGGRCRGDAGVADAGGGMSGGGGCACDLASPPSVGSWWALLFGAFVLLRRRTRSRRTTSVRYPARHEELDLGFVARRSRFGGLRRPNRG